MDIKIIYSEDCGNTPKVKLLRELYFAHTIHDVNLILEHVEDEIQWNITNMPPVLGKEQFAKMFAQLINLRITTVHIKNIVRYGRTGAVNGVLHSVENKNYSFCDIFHFSHSGDDAKIQRIDTYINNSPSEDNYVGFN